MPLDSLRGGARPEDFKFRAGAPPRMPRAEKAEHLESEGRKIVNRTKRNKQTHRLRMCHYRKKV